MANFKEGDVVQLNSGGMKMTVNYVVGSGGEHDGMFKISGYTDGDVSCEWFSNNKIEKGMFKASTIIKVEN